MTSQQTFHKHPTQYSKKQRFKKKGFGEYYYRARNKMIIYLNKINYYSWKEELVDNSINFLYNVTVAGLAVWAWRQHNPFIIGFALITSIILLKTTLKDYITLFPKKKSK